MHLILVVVVLVLLRVSEAVAMTVPMPAARSQFAPRRNRDPTAKSNERDARRCLDLGGQNAPRQQRRQTTPPTRSVGSRARARCRPETPRVPFRPWTSRVAGQSA